VTAAVIIVREGTLRDALEDAALRHEDLPAAGKVAADSSHTEETLAFAWLDFAAAVRARNALDPATGDAHWSEFYDDADHDDAADAQEVAFGWKAVEADEAYGVILHGPGGDR
jgi:hypothetical protein